jgi:outer membrane protein W
MKTLFIILINTCICSAVLAQSNVTTSYVVGFPSGDLSGFIGKTSWRGFSFDYRYSFKPNVALGMNVAWTTFYEELGTGTYTSDNASLTGKQFRYSNQVPLVATVTYFADPEEAMNPFVSFGLGTMYTRRNTDMNFYTLEEEAWNLLLQPEIGFQMALQEGVALALSVKYNYGLEAGSEISNAQSYFALNIGFAFF